MRFPFPQKNSGSVLLATMIFVLAIAAYMIYYLQMIQNSNQTVARAQRWNAALPIAEAGIEEGMANINSVAITTVAGASDFSIPPRNLNGGTYSVSGVASGVTNIITSIGSVRAPITGDLITRTVRVTAQRQALFSKGMISMTFIDMNGNSVASDSWNSHDNSKSNQGHYTSGYSGSNGDVAAVNGIVNIGNHTIKGDLYLGPNSSLQRGDVTGTVYTDWNIPFPPVIMPTNDASSNAITWVAAPGTNTHTFTTNNNNGYFYIDDNGSITVETNTKVTLYVRKTSYVPTGINIKGGTTNAGTIIMYQESGTLDMSGNGIGGAVNNRPENFVYFGMPGVTAIIFSGNNSFVGVVYAPNAAMTLNGGGNSDGFIGSLIVKSVTMNGNNYNFHYDESLMGYYYGYYVVGSWEEL